MKIINHNFNGGEIWGLEMESNAPNLKNYLDEYFRDKHKTNEISKWVKEHCDNIAIINSIHVDEKKRGKGVGGKLLDKFIDGTCNRATEAIILVADSAEKNAFKLESWYESYGFVKIPMSGSICGSLMVFPEEMGESLKESLNNNAAYDAPSFLK